MEKTIAAGGLALMLAGCNPSTPDVTAMMAEQASHPAERPTVSATAPRDLGTSSGGSSSPFSTRPLVRVELGQPEPAAPPPEPSGGAIAFDGFAVRPLGIAGAGLNGMGLGGTGFGGMGISPPQAPAGAEGTEPSKAGRRGDDGPRRDQAEKRGDVTSSTDPRAEPKSEPPKREGGDGPHLIDAMTNDGEGRRASNRDCLARVMFFEGRPDDHASLLAVGTVVMNRVESRRSEWPADICGVVAQARQFSSNPLARSPDYRADPLALSVADEILQGIRYPGLSGVYNFVTEGTPTPRDAAVAGSYGGNTLYRRP